MIVIYIDSGGTARKVSPSHVYQGSNQSGVTVFAPTPPQTAIGIAFRLPDGTSTPYYPMTYLGNSEGLSQYEFTLAASITGKAGQAAIALMMTYSDGSQTSQLVSMEIEPSILPALPSEITEDAYTIIMRYLQQDRADIMRIDGNIESIKDTAEDAETAANNAVATANEAKATADGLAASIAQANETAQEAKTTAEGAVSSVNAAVEDIAQFKSDVNEQIEDFDKRLTDGGTVVSVNGVAQARLAFTGDPQNQIDDLQVQINGKVSNVESPTNTQCYWGTWSIGRGGASTPYYSIGKFRIGDTNLKLSLSGGLSTNASGYCEVYCSGTGSNIGQINRYSLWGNMRDVWYVKNGSELEFYTSMLAYGKIFIEAQVTGGVLIDKGGEAFAELPDGAVKIESLYYFKTDNSALTPSTANGWTVGGDNLKIAESGIYLVSINVGSYFLNAGILVYDSSQPQNSCVVTWTGEIYNLSIVVALNVTSWSLYKSTDNSEVAITQVAYKKIS